jgi:hypothetical protein
MLTRIGQLLAGNTVARRYLREWARSHLLDLPMG